MALRRVLAAAFKHHGRSALTGAEIVAAIAIDRGWFDPDEVRRLIDHGVESGDLEVDGETYRATFDVGRVSIPSGYTPSDDLLDRERPFEAILSTLESAGLDRRDAVAGINRLQADLAVTSDAAALLYAHGRGLDVHREARRVRLDCEAPADG